jgi:hypothetical protein
MIGEPWDGWLAWGVLFLAILSLVLVGYSLIAERPRPYRMAHKSKLYSAARASLLDQDTVRVGLLDDSAPADEPRPFRLRITQPGTLLPVLLEQSLTKSEADFILSMFGRAYLDPPQEMAPGEYTELFGK